MTVSPRRGESDYLAEGARAPAASEETKRPDGLIPAPAPFPSWEIREGDALERLREMADESVQCCVTSPPYFGLRDYGIEGQIGLEPTPDEFVAVLVAVFREVRRVLRADGTLWLNLGDSYAANRPYQVSQTKHQAHDYGVSNASVVPPGCKPKDLLMIPAQVALALRADGWYLRSDIIWAKPNPMPESVGDRPTNSHEHIFLLAKSPRYFYDAAAIREPATDTGRENGRDGRLEHPAARPPGSNPRTLARLDYSALGRNKRNVWEVPTAPYSEAHFATFPPKLIDPCVLAGSPEKACERCAAPWDRLVEREGSAAQPSGWREAHRWGESHAPGDLTARVRTLGFRPSCDCIGAISAPAVVLDPFAGAGTTGLVALRRGRSFVGIELNPAYAEMARERIRNDAPLLNTPAEVAA